MFLLLTEIYKCAVNEGKTGEIKSCNQEAIDDDATDSYNVLQYSIKDVQPNDNVNILLLSILMQHENSVLKK